MPCYQVNTVNIELGSVDHDIMASLLDELDIPYRREGKVLKFDDPWYQKLVIIDGNTATVKCDPSTSVYIDALLKSAYAKKVVEHAANIYGWSMFGESDDEGDYIQLRKY